MASFHRQFGRFGRSVGERRTSSAPEPQSVEMSDTSLGPAETSPPPASPSLSPVGVPDRTERARRRVSALLGHQAMAEDVDRERMERLPKCRLTFISNSYNKQLTSVSSGRKAVGSVFPGFR